MKACLGSFGGPRLRDEVAPTDASTDVRAVCPCGGMAGPWPSWRADRAACGAKGGDPFIASLKVGREALVFSRHTLRKRFRTACRVLRAERLKSLTIHHGRHTFISHALAGGRTLAEVRDAAGHSNVTITSGYLHVVGKARSVHSSDNMLPAHQRDVSPQRAAACTKSKLRCAKKLHVDGVVAL